MNIGGPKYWKRYFLGKTIFLFSLWFYINLRSRGPKSTFIFYGPSPFCIYFKIQNLFNNRTKRLRVNYKLCESACKKLGCINHITKIFILTRFEAVSWYSPFTFSLHFCLLRENHFSLGFLTFLPMLYKRIVSCRPKVILYLL